MYRALLQTMARLAAHITCAGWLRQVYAWLFCRYVGLLCGCIGLFCGYVGLFGSYGETQCPYHVRWRAEAGVFMALLRIDTALWRMYRGLLRMCGYIGLSSACIGLFCRCVQGEWCGCGYAGLVCGYTGIFCESFAET